ncbi:MAG: ATP-binding protein [Gammaproteobacteria bacterium]|nr:ATP-binding protein [Gammaproteobacteria bacterium]
MTDILLLSERVKNSIQLGESHFREFKSAWQGAPDHKEKGNIKSLCGYIGEALVAFANADGGELLVGVEDDGQITGIPHTDADIESLLHSAKTHIHKDTPVPLIQAVRIEIEGSKVLFFLFQKELHPYVNYQMEGVSKEMTKKPFLLPFHKLHLSGKKKNRVNMINNLSMAQL